MVVSVYGCFAPRNQFDCVVNSVSLLSFHMFVHFEMQSELFFYVIVLSVFISCSLVCFYSFFCTCSHFANISILKSHKNKKKERETCWYISGWQSCVWTNHKIWLLGTFLDLCKMFGKEAWSLKTDKDLTNVVTFYFYDF